MRKLERRDVGLLLVDVQEKLFPYIENSCHVMHGIQKIVQGSQIFHLPITVTEQYPAGLGETVATLKGLLGKEQHYLVKTSFSCLDDLKIKEHLLGQQVKQWVLIGVEAHVCILQTARDLVAEGKEVIVINDAIGSRSVYDFATAIAELRDLGVRISSSETILFELLRNSKATEFKEISQLIK